VNAISPPAYRLHRRDHQRAQLAGYRGTAGDRCGIGSRRLGELEEPARSPVDVLQELAPLLPDRLGVVLQLAHPRLRLLTQGGEGFLQLRALLLRLGACVGEGAPSLEARAVEDLRQVVIPQPQDPLDRAPKGRDEGDAFQVWIRRHDEY
jgi:hypothetical protein